LFRRPVGGRFESANDTDRVAQTPPPYIALVVDGTAYLVANWPPVLSRLAPAPMTAARLYWRA
jgi:hypothetical protein